MSIDYFFISMPTFDNLDPILIEELVYRIWTKQARVKMKLKIWTNKLIQCKMFEIAGPIKEKYISA